MHGKLENVEEKKKEASFCHCVIIFLYATKEKNKSQELKNNFRIFLSGN